MRATAEYWDQYIQAYRSGVQNRAEFLGHPLMQEHHQQLRGGQSLEQWVGSSVIMHQPVSRALGIGVGAANFELNLVRFNAVKSYDLYDVSPAMLDEGRRLARSYGIESRVRFFCEDINTTDLPQARYDLVTFISSLHHVEELDSVIHKVKDALTSSGLLFASEYVGPDRFAFPGEHTRFAQTLYRILDPHLKLSWPELPLPDPSAVAEADPTEAVHSERIIATLKDCFPHVDILPLGGALPFILWWGLNHDALYESAQGFDLVQHILSLDTALLKTAVLPTYFAYISAYKTAPGTRHTNPNRGGNGIAPRNANIDDDNRTRIRDA